MAELWGAIERGLGTALSAIFDVLPNYGVAIILLTVAVRVLLIPMTVKQVRSMAAMSKIQPHLKEIQQKYKQDRQKLNEEMMKLYKEHNVNPFGSCLPLLAQMPVFIALFSILRAAVPIEAQAAVPAEGAGTVTVESFGGEELGNVVCRPIEGEPGTNGSLVVRCLGEDETQTPEFRLTGFAIPNSDEEFQDLPSLIATCHPQVTESDGGGERVRFLCRSALGTGHLPKDSDLFQAINDDEAGFLSMRLGCTATQIGSKLTARQCTASEEAAGGLGNQMPYYVLILLIVGTAWYQSKQMAGRAQGQAAQQQKIMTRVMPVFFGFISLSLPAGTNVYFLTTNVWTIGQQAIVLKSREDDKGEKPEKGKKKLKAPPGSEKTEPAAEGPAASDGLPKGVTPKKGKPTPKRKKRRR